MILTPDDKGKVSINIPVKLLLQIDEDRRRTKTTRSAWLTMAAMSRLTQIKEEETERRDLAGEFDKEVQFPRPD